MPKNASADHTPSKRPTPTWYDDAKFGIFIHWGLYSVPGFAPVQHGGQSPDSDADPMATNAYAEWYWNTMQIPGSETARYHRETYGADVPYESFRQPFESALSGWDPAEWADVFRRAGARYVVPTTKHHDGYRLWPSAIPNPRNGDYNPTRDLIGELAHATCAAGMRYGTYYSGGIDWTFDARVLRNGVGIYDVTPEGDDYVTYADGHWRELIERYQPCMLWNDIAYPANSDLDALFADYYAAVPDGIVNNRFSQHGAGPGERTSPPSDIVTPEYAAFDEIQSEKWETCRGIGHSFGYNRMEDARDFLSADEIVRFLVDVVSKNGNLLLNTGPMGDARLQPEQVERLLAVGSWLDANGDAIYGTRPWTRAEAKTTNGGDIRFTARGDTVYATLLGQPSGAQRITGMGLSEGTTATLLATGQPVECRIEGDDFILVMPSGMKHAPAHSFAISPA